MKKPKNIAITGASSGLGKALALHYANPGITLHLHGRHKDRLEAAAGLCRAKGATAYIHVGDVTDMAGMIAWLVAADALSPIDLLIANAGISAGTGIHGEGMDQAKHIFATNVDGTINTVQPMIPLMVKRGRGQIVLMSSLAGLRGLPSSPAYSASKACIRIWGEALRGWLGDAGIEVNVVCPGYIRTPLTDVNDFPMPFLMDADKAARIIAARLERNRARIAFPKLFYLLTWWLTCLPVSWTDPLFARLPAKPSF